MDDLTVRVLRGRPTPEELAAVAVVLRVLAARRSVPTAPHRRVVARPRWRRAALRTADTAAQSWQTAGR
ncbi:acyl-CoA carboxylase epsilon subunit [Kitasatospora mediocidica]|uniref:acyl-CoA carboxylase epsilon subunit n=1 Tax=Kitasatospora mediocidica TaxID=58352 RepID=UPI00056412B2|nr:acyl-CoA carboxylase epsilon subunit [Kitasatospora mediocidica]